MTVDFVSLHNQTAYSILDSLIDPKELLLRAKELGQSAVAITDHGSLAAAWTAWKASKEVGVKLIIGCECYFSDQITDNAADQKLRHLILLAKNATGYRNLLTLNKKGFDQGVSFGKRVYSVIDWKLLEQYAEGLICLTACGNGIVSQLLMNNKAEEAEQALLRLHRLFGDNLGIEVQPNHMQRGSNAYHDRIDQNFLNRQLIQLGKKHGIRVVAACNAHYLHKEQHSTHDVLLAIGSRQPIFSNFRLKYPVPDFYLKSGDEVKAFFSRTFGQETAQALCDNSVYFANQCEVPEWIDPKFSNPSGKELPIFPVKDEADYPQFQQWVLQQTPELQRLEEDKLFLRYRCQMHFASRLANVPVEQLPQYRARIEEELDVLEYHGFSSYMLIVADFIQWAREQGIPVGPGRGSVGGCLVAYLIGIHQADPIKYGLIFARFHNKEKTSFPDIDSDFATSGRDRVQNYLRQKYGSDHVANVSNLNTITPKVYARDIARACELGGDREAAIKVGDDVADCLPNEIHNIEDAITRVPLFVEYSKKYPELTRYKEICGNYRAWSTHAAGLVISARPLVGLVPLRKDSDGTWALELDKDQAEENGLVKIDLLGLSTLDIVEQSLRIVESVQKTPPTLPFNYEENDLPTYEVISKGDTFGVFQLGTSGGTIDLCRRIKPQSINDISAINSLARPSARDMRNDFIATKDGKKPFTLLHPSLQRAFGGTYGFGLYEESLMYLAQDVAGWDLHSADRLRKLTKEKGKNPKKVQQWRSEFIADAVKNKQIPEVIAQRVWDEVISLFSGYGFNNSHSVLYSMTSYQTAYLKAHYPVEFLLANLMAEVKSNSPVARANIAKIKKEIRKNKVKILPPNINDSRLAFSLQPDNTLLTGLDALKFVGDDAILDIINKRPFASFFDFMVRVDSKKVRANNIQALVGAGAMDSFGIPRKQLFLYVSDYRKKLQVWRKKHDPNTEQFHYPWPNEGEWSKSELYALECFYMGEGFVCKPTQAYGGFFSDAHQTVADLRKAQDRQPMHNVKGIVRDCFEFRVKKETSKYYGQAMMRMTIEDKNGEQCNCTIFPDRLTQLRARIKEISSRAELGVGLAIAFSGTANNYEDEMGFIFDKLIWLAPIPTVPADLKARKINLKATKQTKTEEDDPKKPKDLSHLQEMIEDDLYDQGLIDLDNEEENDTD